MSKNEQKFESVAEAVRILTKICAETGGEFHQVMPLLVDEIAELKVAVRELQKPIDDAIQVDPRVVSKVLQVLIDAGWTDQTIHKVLDIMAKKDYHKTLTALRQMEGKK